MSTENEMTADQIASELGITSPVVIENWIQSGDFPGSYLRKDGQWCCSADTVAWVKERVRAKLEKHRRALRKEILASASCSCAQVRPCKAPALTWGDIAESVEEQWEYRMARTLTEEDLASMSLIPNCGSYFKEGLVWVFSVTMLVVVLVLLAQVASR